MGENYSPRTGDRVRVVLEGEVVGTGLRGFRLAAPGDDEYAESSQYVWPDHAGFVSVEKIEPPVRQFGPGDTVRRKRLPELVYSLGREGYYAHKDGQWRPWATYPHDRDSFTSVNYEKVEIG